MANIEAFVTEIVRYLESSSRFAFSKKDNPRYLLGGTCPQCGKKELYVSKEKPFVLDCNRKNNCGFSEHIRDAIPEFFENMFSKYTASAKEPNATADAYLAMNRQFDLSKIRGLYEQGNYKNNKGEIYPTVRFYLDPEKTRYWERFIQGRGNNGEKAHFAGKRKADGSLFRNDAWIAPHCRLENGDVCYITEGIFHAIALMHIGKKAIASLTSNNYPAAIIKSHAKKNIRWIWALDNDSAGQECIKKYHAILKNTGERSQACLAPLGKDWDDIHREGGITERHIKDGLYQGRLLLAESVEEKALVYYSRHQHSPFTIDFGSALFTVELGSEFNANIAALTERLRESEMSKGDMLVKIEDIRLKKEAKVLKDDAAQNPNDEVERARVDMLEQEAIDYRSRALATVEGIDIFKSYSHIVQISNVLPRFLYIERDIIMGNQSYAFSIEYNNGKRQDLINLDGNSITTPASFHQALLQKSLGGTFDGGIKDLKRLRKQWLNREILTVSAVPFIGYQKDLGAYVFSDAAFYRGKRLKINKQGYFTIQNQGIKTNLTGIAINTTGSFDPTWLDDFFKVFHWQGLATLAFFLGSLFVQQVREKQKSFPFFELTGEPGSGKSTLLEFLWRCLGRDAYEGFDLLKSTQAGRRRAFSQVSNLPVVIIESDRERGEGGGKKVQFGFDEVKPFYNGRGTGTLGVPTRGNETDESYFQGALVISQNAEVDGSQALLERIVHCHADKSHHTLGDDKNKGSRELARFFAAQTSETVGGFLAAALLKEQSFLDLYEREFKRIEQAYFNSGLKHQRNVLNHAQVAACGHGLSLLFPSMSYARCLQLEAYILERAKERENRILADHPVLEAFWEAYDYINTRQSPLFDEKLNHSADYENLIALNLNEFREYCKEYGQIYPEIGHIKKLLPYTKRYSFIEANKMIRSRHINKPLRCWVFTKKRS